MKRIVSLALFALCIVFVSDVVAQKKARAKKSKDKKEQKGKKEKKASSSTLSKKELKEWKKRIKKLEPEQYKKLLDENKLLKGQVTNLKTELDNVDDKVSEKDNQVTTYQSQISDLRKELGRLQNDGKTAVRSNSSGSIDENRGVVFKVQIGAYKQKDLSQYDNSKNFSAESADGIQKYTIGVFRDYWEADTFKKYLREMGVKDAWVVSYRDGSRVPIKDVLEGVSKKS